MFDLFGLLCLLNTDVITWDRNSIIIALVVWVGVVVVLLGYGFVRFVVPAVYELFMGGCCEGDD